MTKHTPGPWDVQPLASCQAIQAGPKNRICVLDDHHEHEGEPCGSICSQNKTQEEIDANARLIASAPELLAALQMILRGFAMMEAVDPRGWRRWKDRCGDTVIEFKQGLCDATAAIAKAEWR